MQLEQRLKIAKGVAHMVLSKAGVPESEYSPDDAVQDMWMTGEIVNCDQEVVGYQAKLRTIDLMRSKFGRNFDNKEKNIHKSGQSLKCDVSTCADNFYDTSGAIDESLLALENKEILKKCRKLLNSGEDEALFCRLYSGETLLQVSIRTGVCESTVHNNYNKALEKIRSSKLIKDIIR